MTKSNLSIELELLMMKLEILKERVIDINADLDYLVESFLPEVGAIVTSLENRLNGTEGDSE